jgi:hypothetical protein
MSADGGFRGRGEQSDLYYTVFGLDCLAALGAEIPAEPLLAYLRSFGRGEALDFVHLASLPAGCLSEDARSAILRGIEGHRASDGGYNPVAGAEHGSAYGGYLALGAYGDLEAGLPEPGRMARCIEALRLDDGAYANEPSLAIRTVPGSAAAITVLRHLGRPVDPACGDWLLAQAHPQGGFRAVAAAPIPDLLSTATALHALAAMGVALDAVRPPCLDFVSTLYTPEGAFRGSWLDDTLDCEYTYYGLLALGHLGT